MSLVGKIQSLFLDREKTQPLFPVTKVKAVSDDNGTGLNVLLDNINNTTSNLQTQINGKAPAGYGLGEADARYVDSPDQITNSGFYRSLAPDGVNTARYICVAFSERGKSVIGFSETNNGEIFTRNMKAGAWQPWEWVNPPMQLGVEYRTTERWNGYPVYVQRFEMEALPASGSGYIHIGVYPTAVISIEGFAIEQSTSTRYNFPVCDPNNALIAFIGRVNTGSNLWIHVTRDMSGYKGYFTVKYIKG